MMRRNPGLEKIVFDCKFDDYPGNIKFLMALISNTPQPETPILVWPNLRCLILRTFTGPFWIYTSVVNKISLFLAAHPHLETLGLSIAAGLAYDGPVDYVFSLSSYPESLPRLKVLLGSAYFIAGVLESRSACASVVSVIDDCMILCKLEQDQAVAVVRV
ncbi:hypothetical protein BDV93DRAFT_525804 [Ceratobasidium sp. AG-I]|nr:hypothetical protein BDV93DRAFT_525804 [Ceratobasidium sp. AG-I]